MSMLDKLTSTQYWFGLIVFSAGVLIIAGLVGGDIARLLTFIVIAVDIYAVISAYVVKQSTDHERQKSDILQNFLIELSDIWRSDPDSFRGCSEIEINTLIHQQDVSALPEIYRDFLIRLGKGSNKSNTEVAFFYSDLLELKQKAELVSQQNTGYKVGEDIFVCCGYDDCFLFFVADETTVDDNPPVLIFCSNTQLPGIVVFDRLSYLLDGFSDEARNLAAQQ